MSQMLSIAVILVAAMLLCWPAAAHKITTPIGVTVDYRGLSSPATGASCCNKMDCAPAEVTFNGEGLLIRRLDGYPTVWSDPWFQVNADVILPFSLDGGWHMCKLPRDPGPRCIIRPPDT